MRVQRNACLLRLQCMPLLRMRTIKERIGKREGDRAASFGVVFYNNIRHRFLSIPSISRTATALRGCIGDFAFYACFTTDAAAF